MEDKQKVTIDLGTGTLKLCVMSEGEGIANTVAYFNEFPSSGIKHGKVHNISNLTNALKNALGKAETALGIKINEVMVGVQKYDIKQMELSSSISLDCMRCINLNDIKTVEDSIWDEVSLKLGKNEEVLGIVPQVFTTDDDLNVNVNEIIGMMTENLSATYKVFVGKMSNRQFIDKAFEQAGINSVHSVFVPDTVGNCLLNQSEIEGGVAILDIGAGASSVSIFYGGTLRHYGAIPFGGNNITYDIRNMCGISENLAENIKLGFGGCMPDRLLSLGEKKLKITDKSNGKKTEITTKYLSEIISARCAEIIEALLFEIQESGYADKLKNGIVLTGGCANTMNLCQMITEMSGFNARIGIPSNELFQSDRAFFRPESSYSSALSYRFLKENPDNSCTEPAECVETDTEDTSATCKEKEQTNGTAVGEEKTLDDILRESEEENRELIQQTIQEKEREKAGNGKKSREGNDGRKKNDRKENHRSIFFSLFAGMGGDDDDPENRL